jgi:hypothetical protein
MTLACRVSWAALTPAARASPPATNVVRVISATQKPNVNRKGHLVTLRPDWAISTLRPDCALIAQPSYDGEHASGVRLLGLAVPYHRFGAMRRSILSAPSHNTQWVAQ